MSNVRIDNPAGRTQSATSSQAFEDAASATVNSSTATPSKTEDHFQTDSKTAGALKQRGSEVQSQQLIAANLVKHQLQKHLGNLPAKTIPLDRNAGNDKLAKIHVQRDVQTTPPKTKMVRDHIGNQREPVLIPGSIEPGKETTTTRFPNGVGIRTNSSIEPDGTRLPVSVSIEPPPGGKVVQTPNGGSAIYDKEGKKVGELTTEVGEDGIRATLVVHSKEGEYVQSGDGQIKFTPKAGVK